jgi:hypothetical protein
MKAKIQKCECGGIPDVVKIGSWPAQYRAKCKCGKTAIGPYYGSDDAAYRHRMAKQACVSAWNKVANAGLQKDQS